MPRFKTVDDIFEAFRRAGYCKMESLDPDIDPVFRKAVKLPGNPSTGIVEVSVSKSYPPSVKLIFPTISKGDSHSTKSACISYLRTKEGLFPISVEYATRGGKILGPPSNR